MACPRRMAAPRESFGINESGGGAQAVVVATGGAVLVHAINTSPVIRAAAWPRRRPLRYSRMVRHSVERVRNPALARAVPSPARRALGYLAAGRHRPCNPGGRTSL